MSYTVDSEFGGAFVGVSFNRDVLTIAGSHDRLQQGSPIRRIPTYESRYTWWNMYGRLVDATDVFYAKMAGLLYCLACTHTT
jgi:hypothetical protein